MTNIFLKMMIASKNIRSKYCDSTNNHLEKKGFHKLKLLASEWSTGNMAYNIHYKKITPRIVSFKFFLKVVSPELTFISSRQCWSQFSAPRLHTRPLQACLHQPTPCDSPF